MSLRSIERFVISSILEIFSEQKTLKRTHARMCVRARIHTKTQILRNIMEIVIIHDIPRNAFYCLSFAIHLSLEQI